MILIISRLTCINSGDVDASLNHRVGHKKRFEVR